MTDIVEKLRTRGGRPDGFGLGLLCDEAAAEIERLRAGFRRLKDSSDLEMGDGDLARDIADEMLGDAA